MFGYVRPVRCQLSPQDRQAYDSVYCGLCHAISRRYGPAWTLSLSYDLTFLALLLAALDGDAVVKNKRCLTHPLRGRLVLTRQRALQYAADVTVLLVYHQARDNVRDETGGKRWAARLFTWAGHWTRRRAAARLPGQQEQFQIQLERLCRLEEGNSASLDETADCFGQMLFSLAPSLAPEMERPLAQLLYHLGRWIYLADACADLEEDGRRGRYNPVAVRFSLTGALTDPAREQLALVMGNSLSAAARALSLLPLKQYQSILEHILCQSLPGVTGRILRGEAPHQGEKHERRCLSRTGH